MKVIVPVMITGSVMSTWYTIIPADEHQKPKGDPVIRRSNDLPEACPDEPCAAATFRATWRDVAGDGLSCATGTSCLPPPQ
jgi:hypothetical protein